MVHERSAAARPIGGRGRRQCLAPATAGARPGGRLGQLPCVSTQAADVELMSLDSGNLWRKFISCAPCKLSRVCMIVIKK